MRLLLESKPDAISPLAGRELVRRVRSGRPTRPTRPRRSRPVPRWTQTTSTSGRIRRSRATDRRSYSSGTTSSWMDFGGAFGFRIRLRSVSVAASAISLIGCRMVGAFQFAEGAFGRGAGGAEPPAEHRLAREALGSGVLAVEDVVPERLEYLDVFCNTCGHADILPYSRISNRTCLWRFLSCRPCLALPFPWECATMCTVIQGTRLT